MYSCHPLLSLSTCDLWAFVAPHNKLQYCFVCIYFKDFCHRLSPWCPACSSYFVCMRAMFLWIFETLQCKRRKIYLKKKYIKKKTSVEQGPFKLDISNFSRNLGLKTDGGLSQTFPRDPHNTVWPAQSFRPPPPPASGSDQLTEK